MAALSTVASCQNKCRADGGCVDIETGPYCLIFSTSPCSHGGVQVVYYSEKTSGVNNLYEIILREGAASVYVAVGSSIDAICMTKNATNSNLQKTDGDPLLFGAAVGGVVVLILVTIFFGVCICVCTWHKQIKKPNPHAASLLDNTGRLHIPSLHFFFTFINLAFCGWNWHRVGPMTGAVELANYSTSAVEDNPPPLQTADTSDSVWHQVDEADRSSAAVNDAVAPAVSYSAPIPADTARNDNNRVCRSSTVCVCLHTSPSIYPCLSLPRCVCVCVCVCACVCVRARVHSSDI